MPSAVASTPAWLRRMPWSTLGIPAAHIAERTPGRLCGWLEAKAPSPVDLPVEEVASLKAAMIPVLLYYSTPDALA